MKRISIYTIAALASALLFSSCQEPHYVLPTADRDGFTSLTAYITSGDYNGMELAKLVVTEEMIEEGYLEIPIPYYYPEESDATTTKYLSSLRLKAELDKNNYIEPALTVYDMTEEHSFTYTDTKGDKHNIVIAATRKKSDKATFISFDLVDMFEGFIDNDERKIYLYTKDDLTGCTATAQVSAHSEIVTDLSVPRNYNEPQEIVIKSHSGKKITYTTEKAEPTKIRTGFNTNSLRLLFNVDPKSRYGAPDYFDTAVMPSIASIGGKLVVSYGNGSTPICIHGTTGVKEGEIVLGDAEAHGLANDNNGHMLLSSKLEGKGTLKIWKTSSVTAAPELFYSYESEVALPIGNKIKVYGDIDSDARIVLPYCGVSGITTASQVLVLTVTGGAVNDAEVVSLAGAGMSWNSFPTGVAGFAPAGATAGTGLFTASYGCEGFNSNANYLAYLDDKYSVSKFVLAGHDNKWLWNTNTIDCKNFNNADYVVLLTLNHFPAWGSPSLSIYNVTDKDSLTGDLFGYSVGSTVVDPTSALVANSTLTAFNEVNNEDGTISSGDVTIVPSADGFKIFVYYYDHYSGCIGAYMADCIKRN